MIEQSNSLNDFGLVIAYVIPGFAFLFGCTACMHDLHGMEQALDIGSLTVAALVILIIIAVASGLLVQTVRWLLIDSIHHNTGIKPGNWNFKVLSEQMMAFERLTENHYRFYQFYSGMVVSLVWILACRVSKVGVFFEGTNFLLIALSILMFLGSRDTLRKYYQHLNSILTQA